MFEEIYIYVPGEQQIIKISEGSGDNLTDDDMEQGYVDYIYYECYSREPEFPEVDGGMIMLTELFQEKFKSTAGAIPAVLDMAYGDANVEFMLLY
jgi:hypothetical protein